VKKIIILLFLLVLNVGTLLAQSQPRFPKPDFKNGHVPPETQIEMPRALAFEYIDLLVLIGLLSVMSWFVLRKRSRKGILWTSVFSIFYFGFWREGCVCPIGSIQNITLAIAEVNYVIPITVIAIFLIPLIFTLFFGRTFCAGVCFMGALQDLFIFKPIKIASWVEKTFSVIPYLYLTLAVLLAATNSSFLICKYDPFIGFFRQSANFGMFVFGIIILVTGIFIARPYCRFLCPYGVLLNWMSRVSKWHATVTPSECIQCKLCEPSCPVDAIVFPTVGEAKEVGTSGTKRLLKFILVIPLFMVATGFFVSLFYKPLSTNHPKVDLAEQIANELKTGIKSPTQEAIAFNSSGTSLNQLYTEAAVIRNDFYKGSWMAGIFLGFILALAFIKSSVYRRQKDYVPHKGNCISCGRCYKYCPVGKPEISQLNSEKK